MKTSNKLRTSTTKKTTKIKEKTTTKKTTKKTTKIKEKTTTKIIKLITIITLILLISPIITQLVAGVPSGGSIIYNKTETGAVGAADSSATFGGTFTTLVLNLTQQTPRWKAYVGNVSGSFTLSDSNSQTIYNWNQEVSTGGEVYVSRYNNPQWADIRCAQAGLISNEQNFLNISATKIDSIENTFNESVHKEFWVGDKKIPQSSCPAIATYVNSAPQTSGVNADFQEILLDDTNYLIYTALINQDTIGYNNENYDFQLIVPEDEYATTPTTYYFWVELS